MYLPALYNKLVQGNETSSHPLSLTHGYRTRGIAMQKNLASDIVPRNPITLFDAIPHDLTIDTSDGTEIWTHKFMLSVHSSVFRDMFVVANTGQDRVKVEEDSHAMEVLLRFCYPETDPVVKDLGRLWAVVKAMKKYMVEGDVEVRVLKILGPLIHQEPVRAYALACQEGWEDLAKLAARASLRQDIPKICAPELDGVKGSAVFRLFQYQEECRGAMTHVGEGWVDDLGLFPHNTNRSYCKHLPYSCPNSIYYDEDGYSAWQIYRAETIRRLREKPCVDVVKESKTVAPLLASITKCSSCRDEAYSDLPKLVDAYAQVVDDLTAKVSLSSI
ncbi:hypothetical protein OE88DRAFT_542983 [Heliocybe sulcata]|uniref:BTB domain-containing protein n=1 Tax=Heliocybe sulcata TaxID=5364 RepID=A0A5C3MUE7_9AGAM|nr:hypothetical protein OE88DRAFT_542983 [Heliocybe sulcata]